MSPPAAGTVLLTKKWWVVASGLLVVGIVLLLVGTNEASVSLPGPVSTTRVSTESKASDQTSAPANVGKVAGVARSLPTELTIPAIGLAVSLSTLGIGAGGVVDVPSDIQQPGWFKLGPSPGQDGSAVILGHVDSHLGPAVFFNLRLLVAGDRINVDLADKTTVVFQVTSVATYLKTAFPDQLVYGPHGSSELQLVTCGGEFESQTGHYLSNIVVYSSLISSAPTVN